MHNYVKKKIPIHIVVLMTGTIQAQNRELITKIYRNVTSTDN
jgi:hypothetical protein